MAIYNTAVTLVMLIDAPDEESARQAAQMHAQTLPGAEILEGSTSAFESELLNHSADLIVTTPGDPARLNEPATR